MGGASFVLAMALVILMALTSSRVESCPPSEWASLMAFKAALKEPHLGIFHSWSGTNCCYHWYGITCDPTTGRVAEITLRALTVTDDHRYNRRTGTPYMSGHISPSICNLTQLSSITISDWKGISGNIPRCITTLRFLQIIDLSGNLISGKIPWDIGRLTQLTLLNLADNHISGRIPRTLVNLTNLMQLDLRNNAIEGPIPWDLGRLKRLNRALLSHNRITGRIPRSISEIYGLADLDLALNRLSGSIPFSLGRMKVLDSLNLKYNNLTEKIPWTLLGSRISHLDLSWNWLSGPIPNVFGGKSYFISLDLSHNNLTGSVAKSMVHATYIGHLDLSHNRLCGPIPRGAPFNHLPLSSLDHNLCLCGKPLNPCTHIP
ncbi:DNA damage-repair/toleration protein DRT100-like [Abrus precatorius]|uniref:DNA damage-repair/toleration protein DRT100-like n=1 Tax=Abrus precatorius TaxID=3816 RepID=A0A8B8LGV1_ABRPR|nr:DNA damage-repair/toleration protein DRT100-like [Abrus precatorius]